MSNQASPAPDQPAEAARPAPLASGQKVYSDYPEAMQVTADERKLLFIYFYEPGQNAARDAFETRSLADAGIQAQLKDYVVLPNGARLGRLVYLVVRFDPKKHLLLK